jgi:hypothetical protein
MEKHDPDGCGKCAACLFEKAIEDFQNKKRYRLLDTRIIHQGHSHLNYLGDADKNDELVKKIEDQINALDKEGYEMIAVDHGLAFFRAIPPALPQGMQIIKASDLLKKAEGVSGSDGFTDEDIGEDFK